MGRTLAATHTYQNIGFIKDKLKIAIVLKDETQSGTRLSSSNEVSAFCIVSNEGSP